MVESAKAAIEEVSVEDAIKAMSEDGVLIVDIRDVRERQREGYIPGSFHCPRAKWVSMAPRTSKVDLTAGVRQEGLSNNLKRNNQRRATVQT